MLIKPIFKNWLKPILGWTGAAGIAVLGSAPTGSAQTYLHIYLNIICRFSIRSISLVLGFLFVTLTGGQAQTITYYWKDNAGNGRWDWGNAQWYSAGSSSNVGSMTNSGGAIAYFENTGGQTTYINSGFTGGWFKMNSLYTAANSSGRTYTVQTENGGTGIELYNKLETISGGGALTINSEVQLGAAAEINAVGGALTLSALRMNGQTLNSYGASSLNITGNITGTGTYNIKNQGITVTYSGSGANTFSGVTTVENSSRLILSKSADTAAIGGQLLINSGATVNATAANQLNNQLVSVNGTLNLLNNNQSAALAGTGVVNLGSATLTNFNTATDTFSGNITGTGGLTKSGSGTLNLTGNNSFTGTTTVSSGSLSTGGAMSSTAFVISGGNFSTQAANQITDTATLAVNSGTFTLGGADTLGAISGSGGTIALGANTLTTNSSSASTFSGSVTGSGGLTKNGTGTLTLSGNSSYSGATTVNAGTLKAGSTTGLSNGSALSVAAGATVDLGGFNNTISSLSTATGTITDSSSAGNGGTLRILSAMPSTASAQLFTGSMGIQLFGGSTTSSIITNTSNTYSGGTVFGNGAGTTFSRLFVSGTIGSGSPGAVTSGIYGTGAITLGASTSDRTQFYFVAATTINNNIVINSEQGNGVGELGAIRAEAAGNVLAGAINANLADLKLNAMNAGGRTISITGAISGSYGVNVMTASSGGLEVTLNNAGAANSYAGNTTISTANSTLTLGRADQVANGAGKGNLIINSGTFKMGGFNETINGLSGNGTLDGVSGTPTLTVGDNNATSTFTGVIKNTSGTLALTKIGTGTLTLSGNNTYIGATTVSGGTLEIGAAGLLGGGSYAANIANSGTFLYSGTNDQILSGQISGVGALTKNGSGILTLGGANSYNGTTTVNVGTLKIGNSTGLGNGSAVTVSGGFLDLNGYNATVASLGAGNAAGTITNSAAGSETNILTVNNFNVNLASLMTDGLTAKTGLIFNNSSGIPWLSNANNTFSGGITIANGGASTRMYQLSAVTNTLAGNGTLLKSNFGTGNILIGASGSTAAAQFALTTANTEIYNGIVFNAASTFADGGKAAFRADASGIKLHGTLTAGASDISFSSGGTGSVTAYGQLTGTNGLTLKSSNITLTLTNNSLVTLNDYSGSTTIETSGTLVLGAANQISNGSGKGNLTMNGTFNMGGFSETINGLSGNGTIDGVSGTPTLTVGDNNATSTFAGSIKNTVGTLGLTKTGNGTLTLSGNNSYSGTTTLNVGTISLGHANALGTTGNITFAGGALQYGSGITTDISSRLKNSSSAILVDTNGNNIAFASAVDSTNSGGLTKNGTGTLTISGDNSYSGTTTLNVGTISLGHANALGTTGNITFAGGTLQYGGSITTDISSRLKNSSSAILVDTNGNTVAFASAVDSTNSGGLTKNGTGILTLSGANSYTGATTLNAGTLRIGNNAALGTGTLVVNSSGAVIDSAANTSYTVSNNMTLATNGKIGATTTIGNLTFSGVISGAGNLVVDTLGGITTLTGLNTFTGNVIVDRAAVDGGLSFNSIANAGVASALGAGSSISVGIGASAPYLTYTGNTAASSNRTISLAGSAAYITANSAALTLSGNITSTTQTLRLRGTGGGGANFNELSGVYSGGGSLSVETATGSDVWRISGNNTFTGITYAANNAALIAAHSDAFGSTANGTQVNNNAQILLTGNISVGAEALTLNSAAGGTWNGQSGAALRSYTGNNSWAGLITLGQASTIATNSGADLALSGEISGSHNLIFNSIGNTTASGNITTGIGTLTKTGAGTLILAGSNTYTGTTTISAGVIQIGAGGTSGSLSTSSSITNNANLAFNRTNTLTQGTDFHSVISGTGNVTQAGTGTTVLNGTNTYTGATTINAGTLSIAAITNGSVAGALGNSTTAAGNLVLGGGELAYTGSNASTNRNFTLTAGTTSTINVTQSATSLTISGGAAATNGSLTKAGSGTLILSGANSHSGTTTLSAGTLTLQHANALGTSTLAQSSGTSRLVIDTTGTISNNLSVYNVQASQSATLSGAITVNNAVWDVDSGDTLTISGGVGGTGGVTKNGTGSLVLSGSNTYSGATTVNSGTLNAAHASSLGGNSTVQVHGGSLLVSADDAINGKNLTLASTSTGNGTAASLVFSGNYNGTAGSLTLSENSIIDLGTGSVAVHFTDLVWGLSNTLAIYNWTGTTLWGGGDGNNTDQFYIDRTLTGSELNRISFYSGIASSSFVGTAYQLSGGSFNREIIPVPEPETYATAVILLLGAACWIGGKRRSKRSQLFRGFSRTPKFVRI